MKKIGLHEIRKEFLEFFNEKEHLIADSFSLVPRNDKSLLLINAGMAPLKPYFLGSEQPPRKRMATCQKCIRTADIDNVGKTDRHGTFFEMLGNFSFGDYFKVEAIEFAWEFLKDKLGIPEEKLWVSVYYEDDDAYNIWKDILKINEDRIVKMGKEDNFWEHGLGPCGPCSEIYVDRGEKYGCGDKNCKPGCECDRYVEVWNLVFSQFDKDKEGNYNLLPDPNIDTGMGLERIAVVLNEANNIFEIEPINTILKAVENMSEGNIQYGKDSKTDVSIRVITDHLRAMTFMISDGIIPSNEGRGYVLRRLIRRAYRHGKLLGIEGEFLHDLSSVVINNWNNVYNELRDKEEQIKKIIRLEEQKFQETIEQGMNRLNQYIELLNNENIQTLDGSSAFKLYDTYGFPLDLTKEILKEKGFQVDVEEFNKEMELQRERARNARNDGKIESWKVESLGNLNKDISTDFIGYNVYETETRVLSIIKNGKSVNNLNNGDEGILILESTPFYGESGGQIGDTGTIINANLAIVVTDTKKGPNNIILHHVKVNNGEVSVNDSVIAKINEERRLEIARNHTATHLLHKALKEVVGEHVNQAGSLVEENRLRFDFTHFEALTLEELNEIEKRVNDSIFRNLKVETIITSLDEARKIGAMALFDEKYGDEVRVVKAGNYSTELCGGSHVDNTGNIQIFKLLNETGIASGVRRIEAITGTAALNYVNNTESVMEELISLLKTNKNDIIEKAKSILIDNKALEKQINSLKSQLANSKLNDIINDVIEVEGIKLVARKLDNLDINNLREMGDKLKDKLGSVIVVLGTVKENKVIFMATATKDLVTKGIHAGNIIREVSKVTGGGGGGRPDMAQAGGKDPSKVDEALSIVKDLIIKQIR